MDQVTANEQAVDRGGAPGEERRWYVVHTLSGQEYKVKEMLESRIKSHEMGERIFQVLIPSEKVAEVKAGKKTISARKFFPGYLLVEMVRTDDTYYLVRRTPGVIGFIGSGSPIPLQEHEVKDVLSQIELKREKVKPKTLLPSSAREARTQRPQRMQRLPSASTSGCEASTLRRGKRNGYFGAVIPKR